MVCWGHKINGCYFTASATYATISPRTIFLRTKQMSQDFKATGVFLGTKKPDISMPCSSGCSLRESGRSVCHGTTLEVCSEEGSENDANSSKYNSIMQSAQNGEWKSMFVSHSFPKVSEKKSCLEVRFGFNNFVVILVRCILWIYSSCEGSVCTIHRVNKSVIIMCPHPGVKKKLTSIFPQTGKSI